MTYDPITGGHFVGKLSAIWVNQSSINQSIGYYFTVRPKVYQRAGQLCLPLIGITET